MDDYMFKANVDRCKHVVEATTYLEIFSYSVCPRGKEKELQVADSLGPVAQYG